MYPVLLICVYQHDTSRPHSKEFWLNAAQIVSLEPQAGYTVVTMTETIENLGPPSRSINVRESPQEIEKQIQAKATGQPWPQ